MKNQDQLQGRGGIYSRDKHLDVQKEVMGRKGKILPASGSIYNQEKIFNR